jgi:hypothetical protein
MSEDDDIYKPRVTGSPAEIWLVYGDIDEDCNHHECLDVCWCEDQQFDSDVRYVRADFAEAKLDAKAEELEALRGFARHAYINTSAIWSVLSIETFRIFGLIDENGKPTPLLTRVKE